MSENKERPIRDMKGLLKFCMEATRHEDVLQSASAETMPEDRKQWLEEALTNMSVEPVKRMMDCLKMIDEAEIDTEEGTEKQLTAVAEIGDWVEDLDLAVDFVKINGLRIIPKLLSSQVSDLRWNCLELIANLCQNNPRVQRTVLDLKLLPSILEMVRSDPNPTVRIKALYALSCLARSNVLAQQEFVANDGLFMLAKALSESEEKLRIKATFMISSMCQSNPALKDAFLDKGIVQQMVMILKGDHCTFHEHLMSALLSLVSSHPATKQFCLQEDLDLKSFLVKRINFLEGKEQFLEERNYAEELLAALNTPSPDTPLSSTSNNALLPA